MSYVFNVGDDTVWSPALRVGDLYVRFLREIAKVLGESTRLTAVASDMYDIDVEVYSVLVRKIVDLYFSSGHPVLRGLLEGVLVPSVAVLDRAGRPLEPHSDEERDLYYPRALPAPSPLIHRHPSHSRCAPSTG